MGDKVIQFPGAAGRKPPDPGKPSRRRTDRDAAKDAAEAGKDAGASMRADAVALRPAPSDATTIDGRDLSDDQRKALQIVLSGMPFVAIGVKPTGTGADFFTAVHGEAGDLRNAEVHLAGVIARAFARKGI